jgi:hypothetical protein
VADHGGNGEVEEIGFLGGGVHEDGPATRGRAKAVRQEAAVLLKDRLAGMHPDGLAALGGALERKVLALGGGVLLKGGEQGVERAGFGGAERKGGAEIAVNAQAEEGRG